MAGNNLSPRQKMINMMYLVLTALLALNVSAEILQAFESLRSSLETTADSHGMHNMVLAEDIIKTIDKQESQKNTKYSYVRGVINEINTETDQMVAYLNEITGQLEEFGGKDAATGELTHKDETNKNYRFWMGENDLANSGSGNGEAREMREKINSYIQWANDLYSRYDSTQEGLRFKPLILEPHEDDRITDPESKNKTWEYHTFNNKPVIADMAMIEKFKMDIRDVQTGMLNLTKNLVKGFTFTVDSLIAFEAPSASVLAAGMKYETTIGVGIASKSIRPEFTAQHSLSLNEGGSTATMSITANGNVIPEGKAEGIQRYTAMIKVPKADGTIQEIPLEGQFTVRKPEVQVRSKELQILYRGCGNTVVVDVPSLGDLYNPDFSRSTGGQIIKTPSNRKEITIVPTSRKFDLSVHTNTNGQNIKLDKLTYKVVNPPKPRIAVFTRGGKEYRPGTPLSKRGTVKIKVLADKEFAASLRKDARYKARTVKLLLQDGLGPPRLIKTYNAANIQSGVDVNLYQGAIRSVAPGARIYFEVEDVRRVNFQGKSFDAGLDRYELTIPAFLGN